VSVVAASAGLALARRRHRRRRVLIEAGSVILAVILLIWSLLPVYTMFLIALDPEEGEIEFTGNIWPPEPSLEAFGVVLTQADRYLADFWRQFGNMLTVLIGSSAGFASRMGHGGIYSLRGYFFNFLLRAFLHVCVRASALTFDLKVGRHLAFSLHRTEQRFCE
jgi:ABC-type glycerol-3-phosphate transport system permease component